MYILPTKWIFVHLYSDDFTLENCLLGTFKLTKNADPDKYFYSGYDAGSDGIAFDKNVIITT